VVRRFDEVLLEKASKFSVDHLREKMHSFITDEHLQKYQQEMIKVKVSFDQKIQEVLKEMVSSRSDIFDEMEIKTNSAFIHIKKQVLDSLGGKPVDIDELKLLLNVKADKAEIGILDKLKADKGVTDGFESSIKFCMTQIEQFLTLIIENFKSDISNKSDTAHTKINKKASILNQLISVYNCNKKNSFKSKRESWSGNDYQYGDLLWDAKVNDMSQFTNKVLPKQASKLLHNSNMLSKRRLSCSKESRPHTSHRRSYKHIHPSTNTKYISSKNKHLRLKNAFAELEGKEGDLSVSIHKKGHETSQGNFSFKKA